MDYTVIVIITNTLVVLATFIATIYRIKLEREQIQTVKRNVQAKDYLASLHKYIKAEPGSISIMNERMFLSKLPQYHFLKGANEDG
jgi:hypothetical protein